MRNIIKSLIVPILIISSIVGSTSLVYATPSPTSPPTVSATAKSQACKGLTQLGGVDCSSQSGKNVVGNVSKIVVNILATIVGVISVIMIIFAGFRYVTAGGDSNSINSARNTLIFALVGLVIAVLAGLIANDVLNTATKIVK